MANNAELGTAQEYIRRIVELTEAGVGYTKEYLRSAAEKMADQGNTSPLITPAERPVGRGWIVTETIRTPDASEVAHGMIRYYRDQAAYRRRYTSGPTAVL